MRTHLLLAALVLVSLSFPAFGAGAPISTIICNPHTSGFTGTCVGYGCTTSGETTMDGNRQNLVACLENESGALIWKAMTSGAGGSCYTDYSLAPNRPVGSSCMVSGFTVKGSVGWWGVTYGDYHLGGGVGSWNPPGGPLPPAWVGGAYSWSGANIAEAYLCCQN